MDRSAFAIVIGVVVALFYGAGVQKAQELPAPEAAAGYYRVQPGDTLFRIARLYGVSPAQLAQMNRLGDPDRLAVGQVLRVPGPPPREPVPASFSLEEAGEARLRLMSDEELLARLIHLEARGEPLEGQVAVGAVVLNRVRSPGFPDTVYEVVLQPGQFGFSAEALLAARPGPTAYEAARQALAGADPSGGALFFYNPETTRTPWFWASRPVLRRIGRHVFTL